MDGLSRSRYHDDRQEVSCANDAYRDVTPCRDISSISSRRTRRGQRNCERIISRRRERINFQERLASCAAHVRAIPRVLLCYFVAPRPTLISGGSPRDSGSSRTYVRSLRSKRKNLHRRSPPGIANGIAGATRIAFIAAKPVKCTTCTAISRGTYLFANEHNFLPSSR